MSKVFTTLLAFLLVLTTFGQNTNIYDYQFTDIDGNEVKIEQFRGKKILFINVASKCGFTPQYEGLQELHEKYGEKVVLIGFPCNQFMKQEPGSEDDIKAFCQKNYGVEFLMASKIDVKGKNQHPIYQWLTTKELNQKEDSKVSWNFQKYLVDEQGNYIQMFKPGVKPMSEELLNSL